MENKRIAVYYIATGVYKSLFPEFLESIHNFFPKCQKIIKLISDGLEEYKNYEKENVKVELCPRINNYPWPVVALYKMWHIIENRDDTCDYACYFNGNAIVYEHDENVFNLDKLTVPYHSFNSKNKPYDAFKYINLSKETSAYLENGTYEYVQSGFFFGKCELVYKMCEEVNKLLKMDTCRHIFAQWHDESYLNKWCVQNEDKIERKYVFTAYKEEIDKNTFIFLRNKKDYNIYKNILMSA